MVGGLTVRDRLGEVEAVIQVEQMEVFIRDQGVE